MSKISEKKEPSREIVLRQDIPYERPAGIFISFRSILMVSAVAGSFGAGYVYRDAPAGEPASVSPPQVAVAQAPSIGARSSGADQEQIPAYIPAPAVEDAGVATAEHVAEITESPDAALLGVLSRPLGEPSGETLEDPQNRLTSVPPIDVDKISDPTVRAAVEAGLARARERSSLFAVPPVPVEVVSVENPDMGEIPQMSSNPAVDGWDLSDNEGETYQTGAASERYAGQATIVSPDTIAVDGVMFRISDVLVPDITSVCYGSEGAPYDCLAWAMNGMAESLNNRSVVCVSAEPLLGSCEADLGDGRFRDIGSWLVSSGVALAGAEEGVGRYVAEEALARTESRGVWSGGFSFSGRTYER